MHTRLFPLCDKYDEVRHSHHLINVLSFWQKHLNKHTFSAKIQQQQRWAWIYFEWFLFLHTLWPVPAGSNWAPQSWIHTWVCDYEILHISFLWGGNLSGEGTGLRSKRAHSSEGGGGAGGAGAADLFEASDLSFSFTLSLSHSLHTGEFTDMDNFFGRVVNRKFSRCVSLPVNQLALFLGIKLKGSDLGLYRLFTPPPHVAARLQSKDRTTECFHLFSQPCCWLTPSFCPIVFFSLT